MGDIETRYLHIAPVGDIVDLQEATARMLAVKPDGKAVYNDCIIKDDYIYAPLSQQILAVEGSVIYVIELRWDGGKLLTSFPGVIKVVNPGIDRDAIESTTDFSALSNAIEDVKSVMDRASLISESAPYIGENGNWFVWADGQFSDSGISAQGKKGDTGERGSQGIPGETFDPTELQSVINESSIPTTDTAQVARINGAIGNLPLDITARAVAIQGGVGDASPDNIRPISGVDKIQITRFGKNLFDKNGDIIIGKYISVTGSLSAAVAWNVSDYIKCSEGMKLILSGLQSHPNTNTDNILFYDSNKSNIGFKSFTVSGGYSVITPITGASFLRFSFHSNDSGSAMTYEQYNDNTFNIALPETVYGLTNAPVAVDITKGIINNTTKIITLMGNEDWVLHGSITSLFMLVIESNVYTSTELILSGCSHYPAIPYTDAVSASRASGQSMGGSITPNRILIRDTRFESLSDFKDYLSAQYSTGTPVQVVYRLKESSAITIDTVSIPSLSGANTVYTDAGGETTITGQQGLKMAYNNLANAIIAIGGTVPLLH